MAFYRSWHYIVGRNEAWGGTSLAWYDPNPITGAGYAGVEVMGTHAENGVRNIALYNGETTLPVMSPSISVQAYATSATTARIELQWPGATDAVPSSGHDQYVIFRNGRDLHATRKPNYVDSVNIVPGGTYDYTIYAQDVHYNYSQPRTLRVVVPGAEMRDPRRVGVRPDGAYQGHGGENIDLQSGNVQYELPLVTAKGRAGLSPSFSLFHNGQMWRKDSGGVWNSGRDTGYGFGWRFAAGSITPMHEGVWNIAYYIFTDSTGAEYRLDQHPAPGADAYWVGPNGLVTYKSNARRLRFNDGTFWLMNVEAGEHEQDAGTLYPGVIQDVHGNQIRVDYRAGLGSAGPQTSGRPSAIIDTRQQNFTFTYDSSEHLTKIEGPSTDLRFLYHVSTTIVSPWGVVMGQAKFLDRVVDQLKTKRHQFWYVQVPNHSGQYTGELSSVVLPHDGQIRWSLRDFTYVGGRTVREIAAPRSKRHIPSGTTMPMT